MIIYYFCFDLNLNINFNLIDFILSMADNKDLNTNNNISVGANATVNINNPKFSFSISDRSINTVAAALSSGAGATAGLKVVQYIGGTPASKLAVGLATMVAVQAGTAGLSKNLNSNNQSKNNVSKLVCNFISNENNNGNNVLNDYPLNLINDIDQLLYGSLLFLIIIFNIYLANSLLNINYIKYIPSNKFGKLLLIVLNRYINLLSKSKKLLLIFCYLMLFISIILAKVFIYIIINHFS